MVLNIEEEDGDDQDEHLCPRSVKCQCQRQQQLATSACASNTFPIFERFYPILALLLPGYGKLGPRAGLID